MADLDPWHSKTYTVDEDGASPYSARDAEHYPRPMLRLLAIPVSDDDARRLIADGSPDALAAAAMPWA